MSLRQTDHFVRSFLYYAQESRNLSRELTPIPPGQRLHHDNDITGGAWHTGRFSANTGSPLTRTEISMPDGTIESLGHARRAYFFIFEAGDSRRRHRLGDTNEDLGEGTV
jgi:hypothetical protein